jgi:ketosteroid isomerase-like protein
MTTSGYFLTFFLTVTSHWPSLTIIDLFHLKQLAMEMNGINRSTEDVFNHHMDAFLRKDLKDLATDFNEKSIFITSTGEKRIGVDAISDAYSQIFQSLEQGSAFDLKQVNIEDDIVFLEWTLKSPSININDGVDTFVIRDGSIHAQTVRYSMMQEAVAGQPQSSPDSHSIS